MQDEHGIYHRYTSKPIWDRYYICANTTPFGGAGGQKLGETYADAPNVDHDQASNPRLYRSDLVLISV